MKRPKDPRNIAARHESRHTLGVQICDIDGERWYSPQSKQELLDAARSWSDMFGWALRADVLTQTHASRRAKIALRTNIRSLKDASAFLPAAEKWANVAGEHEDQDVLEVITSDGRFFDLFGYFLALPNGDIYLSTGAGMSSRRAAKDQLMRHSIGPLNHIVDHLVDGDVQRAFFERSEEFFGSGDIDPATIKRHSLDHFGLPVAVVVGGERRKPTRERKQQRGRAVPVPMIAERHASAISMAAARLVPPKLDIEGGQVMYGRVALRPENGAADKNAMFRILDREIARGRFYGIDENLVVQYCFSKLCCSKSPAVHITRGEIIDLFPYLRTMKADEKDEALRLLGSAIYDFSRFYAPVPFSESESIISPPYSVEFVVDNDDVPARLGVLPDFARVKRFVLRQTSFSEVYRDPLRRESIDGLNRLCALPSQSVRGNWAKSIGCVLMARAGLNRDPRREFTIPFREVVSLIDRGGRSLESLSVRGFDRIRLWSETQRVADAIADAFQELRASGIADVRFEDVPEDQAWKSRRPHLPVWVGRKGWIDQLEKARICARMLP